MSDHADDCIDCLVWETRYRVAVRVSYYLAIRLHTPGLRQRVLDDISAAWLRLCRQDRAPDSFDDYFGTYVAAVESGIDWTAGDLDREGRRVWREHACSLDG